MDYLKQPFGFKVRKVLRYLRLYGPSRTYMKILGQKHMRRNYNSLPSQIGGRGKKHTVGIIGCGNYPYSTIAYFLRQEFGDCIASCMDIDIHRAASFSRRHRVPLYTDNADEVIADRKIRLVYIASNHATHGEYAIRAIESGKDVYIEKPHVVNADQLHRLYDCMRKHNRKVFLGFNRPGSRLGKLIDEYCAGQDGPGMFNWFVAGHAIDPDHWYFSKGEGGRVLGNLCHWTDFTMRLVPFESVFPVTITPTRYIKSDCDIAVNYVFADGSVGSITFSSKGHTFEGVRESFRAQKGNVLITMDDFKRLTVEVVDKKRIYSNAYRDHGHRANVIRAYHNVHRDEPYHQENETSYIANTAWLFLKTREALEANERMTIDSYERSLPSESRALPKARLERSRKLEDASR
jgi:predicted dehydrogenase